MLSPDRALNPFLENIPTVAQLRSDYQTMMTGDTIKEKASKSSFFNDKRIAEGFEQRGKDRAVQAARLIIEQVGKMDPTDLREAVAPEDLKEVLLRGGAGVEALLMIGEGEGELKKNVEERQRQLLEIQRSVELFAGNQVQSILGRMLTKLKEAEVKLITLEKNTSPTKDQAKEYALARMNFAEQLRSALSANEQYKEEAARQKRKKDKSSGQAKSHLI